ncbi:zinc finger protein 570-like isoform X2 [Artemia franciscana]|uniref:zinc finger protein 570-like isoform X2 n=1 Tax=Artemia franciscana TaxID=6661 RepID=UPI0032DA59C0
MPFAKCVVLGCDSNEKNRKSLGVRILKFPANKISEWLIAVNRSDLLESLTPEEIQKRKRICSKHFPKSCLMAEDIFSTRGVVKPNTVPSVLSSDFEAGDMTSNSEVLFTTNDSSPKQDASKSTPSNTFAQPKHDTRSPKIDSLIRNEEDVKISSSSWNTVFEEDETPCILEYASVCLKEEIDSDSELETPSISHLFQEYSNGGCSNIKSEPSSSVCSSYGVEQKPPGMQSKMKRMSQLLLIPKEEIGSDCEPLLSVNNLNDVSQKGPSLYIKSEPRSILHCSYNVEETQEEPIQVAKKTKKMPLLLPLSGEKAHECHLCKKVFSQKYTLANHMRVHTGDRPYECDVCKKTFTRTDRLYVHRRIHSGEKPYKCVLCDRSFYQSSDLSKHMRTHTGEKPYECDVCKKSFTRIEYLSVHRRAHTGERPYECSICKKTFTRTDRLSIHHRVHTGEKPYTCTLCGKSFSQNNDLSRHMRFHTGEKPYTCAVCSKSFSQSNNLSKHMKIHSSEKLTKNIEP